MGNSNVNIKSDLEDLNNLIPDIKKDYAKRAPKPIRVAYLSTLDSAQSPVRGKRFKPLSRKYAVRKAKAGYNSGRNLRRTRQLYNKFYVSALGGITSKLRLVLGFKEYTVKGKKINLAQIHNSLGAGKSRVVSRILPTENGEEFRPSIQRVIFNTLKVSVRTVIQSYRNK